MRLKQKDLRIPQRLVQTFSPPSDQKPIISGWLVKFRGTKVWIVYCCGGIRIPGQSIRLLLLLQKFYYETLTNRRFVPPNFYFHYLGHGVAAPANTPRTIKCDRPWGRFFVPSPLFLLIIAFHSAHRPWALELYTKSEILCILAATQVW